MFGKLETKGILGNIFRAIEDALAPFSYSVTDHGDGTASIESDKNVDHSWHLSAAADNKISLRWSGRGDARPLPKTATEIVVAAVKKARGN